MLFRRLIPLACALLLGCDPAPEPVGEAEASDGESDSMSGGESTTGGATSVSGSTGSASDSMSSGLPTTTTAVTSFGSEGTDTDDTDDIKLDVGGGTGTSTDTDDIPTECELEPFVCDVVENGKVLPEDVVDCGSVSLDDAADDYGEMQSCILAASAKQQAYKGFAELQGIDSEVWVAWGSIVGFVYSEQQWSYDNDQGVETIWVSTCTPVQSNPDCAPGPEQGLCLTCSEETEQPTVVCSSE